MKFILLAILIEACSESNTVSFKHRDSDVSFRTNSYEQVTIATPTVVEAHSRPVFPWCIQTHHGELMPLEGECRLRGETK